MYTAGNPTTATAIQNPQNSDGQEMGNINKGSIDGRQIIFYILKSFVNGKRFVVFDLKKLKFWKKMRFMH